MKYIELYLNQRQKELEEEKERIIWEFKTQYKNSITNESIEELIENCAVDYYIRIDWANKGLEEVKKLREDLLGSDKE